MNQNQRFLSLDVFRGLTVAAMILVNTPGSWSFVWPPFLHASWHGCTPTDLVFPFFLFAVGNAMSFAMKKMDALATAQVLRKIASRTLLIFFIGLLLNWFPFFSYRDGAYVFKDLDHLRIFGVLQRIALCYGIAALLLYFLKIKGALIASAAMLLGYWWFLYAFGTEDPYSLAGYAGLNIDLAMVGANHLYHGEGVPFDPEGFLSTFPAVGNVVLAGPFFTKELAK